MPTQACTTTICLHPGVCEKMSCAKLFRITAPAGQAVQALQKPLESGGPRKPGRGLAAGALRVRGSQENRPLHPTRGSLATPGTVVSPTETADPGAPRWQIRTEDPPRLPALAPANGQCGGFEEGAHVSDTEGSPTGRPRCYRRGQGVCIGGQRVLGRRGAVTGNRSQSLPPTALGTSAEPPCWGVHCLMSPVAPPAVGVGRCTPPKTKICERV